MLSFYSKGFSLVETIVSIGILMVVMIAVYAFESNVFIYNNQAQNQINNTWQAETILKVIAKELRTMVPSATGSYPIYAATDNSITFFSNVDADSSVEQVRYFFVAASSTLNRGVIDPSGSPLGYTGGEVRKILADGVRASSTLPFFQYFDSTYEGTTTPIAQPGSNISNIRFIKINLIIDSDPNRSPSPRVFTTGVSLRNLKNNQ